MFALDALPRVPFAQWPEASTHPNPFTSGRSYPPKAGPRFDSLAALSVPITHITHKGRSWPIDEFVTACLNGDCDYPAPIAATILENHREYNNRGTVSGSQLHTECDYSRLLERLPYSQEISNMFYATFRGSNVHAMIEKCKEKPEFKDWIFEERYFATIAPDDTIDVLHVPLKRDGTKDWDKFKQVCADLVARGYIILSGQVDTFDRPKQTLEDWKTAKSVGEWTKVKQSWQQQMNQYSLVLMLNGHPVRRIRITVMDATEPVVLEVPVPDLEIWAGAYLVPRARFLAWTQSFSPEEIQAINDGLAEPPAGFPEPVVNYLCNGGKTGGGKIYCPFRAPGPSQCKAWHDQDLTTQLEASLAKIHKEAKK